ncbi:MAG: internal scaffolding protein [Microvirus sp.]|nr:MAG: internal scaffolding protein [Microvirus sp.]
MKLKPSLSPSETTVEVLRSFYRPHAPVKYDGLLLNHKTGEYFVPERRTKQSHVAECDINTIMKQYQRTGQIAHISSRAAQGAYTDLPDEVDFQMALNVVLEGQTAFATLPSKTRDRFGNDPNQFLAFMANPENTEEARKMGLLNPKSPAPSPTSLSSSPAPTGGDGGSPPSKGAAGPVASEKGA